MILCITEKPSVGRDIAKILGANVTRDGYIEGNGYWVTWTFGHLCCLKEPADYTDQWKRWSMSCLPMIPPRFGIKLIDNKSSIHQFEVIKSLIAKASEIINCGDAGQEGELIQRWVMQKAGTKIPVKRLWISSLTDQAIKEGFKNLKPDIDLKPLYEAGLCRAIGDWVLGMNATRLYTLKYAARSEEKRGVLSIGRVQTPTLALIVRRQKEIDEFVPKDTWEIKTVYRGGTFTAQGTPYDTEEKAREAMELLAPLPITITDFTKKRGNEAPPRLFDLTSLQVECDKKFSYGAEDTLSIIQSLYEKKLTTYPRVDTTYLPEDQYEQCKKVLVSLSHLSHFVEPLKGRGLLKSKKVFDNSKITDHHAIIPTGQPLPSNLSEKERNVFDLIAKRFIAAFYPDFTYEQTTVNALVGKTKFKATGRVTLNRGWKDVLVAESSSDKTEAKNRTAAKEAPGLSDPHNKKESVGDDSAELPLYEKGESGPHKPKLAKKTSQPPKNYTEGTLLRAMETAGASIEDEDLREALKANGIGRPSTRAAIIEVLFKRGYIIKKRKSLYPTQAGMDLIGIIQDELLKSAELTGIWENKLRMIERGEYSPAEFIGQLKKMIHHITINVMKDNSGRRIQT